MEQLAQYAEVLNALFQSLHTRKFASHHELADFDTILIDNRSGQRCGDRSGLIEYFIRLRRTGAHARVNARCHMAATIETCGRISIERLLSPKQTNRRPLVPYSALFDV